MDVKMDIKGVNVKLVIKKLYNYVYVKKKKKIGMIDVDII